MCFTNEQLIARVQSFNNSSEITFFPDVNNIYLFFITALRVSKNSEGFSYSMKRSNFISFYEILLFFRSLHLPGERPL